MNAEIIIAALSLLVAALAEGRALWKDKKRDEIRTSGIALLQLVRALDKVIEVGDQLINILSQIPITEGEDKTRYATLRKKKEILSLVNEQYANLSAFEQIYNDLLTNTNPELPVTLKDCIELMIPDQKVHVPGPKGGYLKVLTWKLVEGESPFSSLRFGAIKALNTYVDSIEVDKELTVLSLSIPTKIRIKEREAEVVERETYDLKRPQDLQRLLSKAKTQLDEIKEFREQLTQLILSNLSLADLLAVD